MNIIYEKQIKEYNKKKGKINLKYLSLSSNFE